MARQATRISAEEAVAQAMTHLGAARLLLQVPGARERLLDNAEERRALFAEVRVLAGFGAWLARGGEDGE